MQRQESSTHACYDSAARMIVGDAHDAMVAPGVVVHWYTRMQLGGRDFLCKSKIRADKLLIKSGLCAEVENGTERKSSTVTQKPYEGCKRRPVEVHALRPPHRGSA